MRYLSGRHSQCDFACRSDIDSVRVPILRLAELVEVRAAGTPGQIGSDPSDLQRVLQLR